MPFHFKRLTKIKKWASLRGYFEDENELEEDALNDEEIDLESSGMRIPSV